MTKQGSIDCRPRADGTTAWRVRWTDTLGRHTRTFETAPEARMFLARIGLERAKGTYQPPSQATIESVVGTYLERSRGRLSPSTIRNYAERARLHIYPYIGTVAAERLTTPQAQAWIDDLVQKGLGPGSVQPIVSVLMASMNEAVRVGTLQHNPARGVRVPTIRQDAPLTWTAEQARTVLRCVADEPMWHAVYLLMLTVGMRPGELRALQWRDLDMARNRLHIRRTTSVREDGTMGTREGTKRGTGRLVVLGDVVVDALRRWRGDASDPFIFGGASALPRHTWDRYHAALLDRAAVPKINRHAMRHTCASLMMDRGVHPRVVADVLGHSNITMTLNRYSHVSDAMQSSAAELMRDMLGED